jgi:prepilin peptidase CpaA
MLATVLLLGLLIVATVTDLARHRIYNWTTYPGVLAAWAINALGTVWLAIAGASAAGGQQPVDHHPPWLAATGSDPETLCDWLGCIGLRDSLLGFLVCGAVLVVCFVLFKVGGGDVKLMAMLGAFLGVDAGLRAMLWTFVLGGCTGLIVLVWRVGPVRLAAAAARYLVWVVRLGRFSPLSPDQRAKLQPPLFLAPSALVAAVIVRFGLMERWGIGGAF